MSAIDTPNFFKKECTKYEDIWTFVFIGDCIFYVEFSFTNEGTHWRFFKNGRQLSCTILEHFVFIDEKNQTSLCLKLIVMFERHVLIKICRW